MCVWTSTTGDMIAIEVAAGLEKSVEVEKKDQDKKRETRELLSLICQHFCTCHAISTFN